MHPWARMKHKDKNIKFGHCKEIWLVLKMEQNSLVGVFFFFLYKNCGFLSKSLFGFYC